MLFSGIDTSLHLRGWPQCHRAYKDPKVMQHAISCGSGRALASVLSTTARELMARPSESHGEVGKCKLPTVDVFLAALSAKQCLHSPRPR